MEQEVFKLAASQGVWAVLFIALFFYVLRSNEKREERLLDCLEKLGGQYEKMADGVEHISDCVSEIKGDMKELKGKVGA